VEGVDLSPGFAYIDKVSGHPHIWVVVSHPDPQKHIAIVMLTTRREHSNDSCILRSIDHRRLSHDTVIAFPLSTHIPQQRLAKLVEQRMYVEVERFNSEVLRRIQTAVARSFDASRDVQRSGNGSLYST